jgi:hypothetical protein
VQKTYIGVISTQISPEGELTFNGPPSFSTRPIFIHAPSFPFTSGRTNIEYIVQFFNLPPYNDLQALAITQYAEVLVNQYEEAPQGFYQV